ncbi:hypothetical protein [Corynebacterium sp. H127]
MWITGIVFFAMVAVATAAGFDSDNTYFGAESWHYLAWVLAALFLGCVA